MDVSAAQKLLCSAYEKRPDLFTNEDWGVGYSSSVFKHRCGKKLVVGQIKKLLPPSIVNNLPDKILVHNSSSTPPLVSLLGSDRLASFAELLSLCQQAPVGKGEVTVLDLDVRKVKQVKENSVVVCWEGIHEALAMAMEELVVAGNSDRSDQFVLREEFHKLLVYEEDDFFEYHQDSKKSENHVFTLAVDCGYRETSNPICDGGEVYFSELYSDEDAQVWKSQEPGDWCCWFATEPHKVARVTKGRRVIATYNVMMEERSSRKRKDDNNNKNKNNNNYDNAENPVCGLLEDIKKIIISNLNMQCLSRLSSTCKIAYLQYGGTPTHCGFSRLGFLFHHMYSFDGKEEFTLNRLHGRDYILLRAVQNVFGATSIEEKKCEIIEECRDEETTGIRYRIAEKVISKEQIESIIDHFYENDASPTVEDKNLESVIGKSKFKQDEVEFLNYYYTEIDDHPEDVFVPFLGVLWVTYSSDYFYRYARRTHHREEAYQYAESLWGNEACFSIYAYKDVGMIVDISKSDVDINNLTWDKDYLSFS